MNVVFMGTPDFAVPTLQKLIDEKHAVQAVITQPDRAKGRGRTIIAPPVKLLAEKYQIPVWQPQRVRAKEVVQNVRDIAPDVIVVVAYGQILPEAILRIPRLGCVNVHASLLPKYRGAAPIHRAIIRGETETGITTMLMDKGMDTGDMLLQRTLPIQADDTAGTLHDRLCLLGANLLSETLKHLEAGTLAREPQDHDRATYAPMLKKEDGRVQWQETATEIDRKVRGLFPWPGAFTSFRGKTVKLLQVAVEETSSVSAAAAPGTVIQLDNTQGPLIATGEGGIRILRIQPPNKHAMNCSDFCRGYRLSVGDRLGS